MQKKKAGNRKSSRGKSEIKTTDELSDAFSVENALTQRTSWPSDAAAAKKYTITK